MPFAGLAVEGEACGAVLIAGIGDVGAEDAR
jgi:hypothetical protein